MTNRVQEAIALPETPGGPKLAQVFREYGFRLNRCVEIDGTEVMAQPFRLATFTVATQPAASAWPGGLIFVSDGGGAGVGQFRGSDGTNWLVVSLKGAKFSDF